MLNGRIPWASNLIAPFLVVTAAASESDVHQTIVVALHSTAPGLDPAPYPKLLALDATGSTTIALRDVKISADSVIATDVHRFVHRVLGRFLLLQGAFCSGLANRSIEEAAANLGAMGDPLRSDLASLAADVAEADDQTVRLAAADVDRHAIDDRELLSLRLRWSELATAAVRLELAATGGRGYLSSSATARRVREAAFLPIQAPTEVLLRWLLSRSA